MTSYVSLPMYGANIDERMRLIAGKCQSCGQLAYPQRPVCTKCGSDQFDDMPLSGDGTLYTYSIVAGNGAPSEFDDEQTMTVACSVFTSFFYFNIFHIFTLDFLALMFIMILKCYKS